MVLNDTTEEMSYHDVELRAMSESAHFHTIFPLPALNTPRALPVPPFNPQPVLVMWDEDIRVDIKCLHCSILFHWTSHAIQMLTGVSSAITTFSSVVVVAPRHASMLLCTSLKIFVASRMSSSEKARLANIRVFVSLRSVAISIFDWNTAYSSHHAFSRSLPSSIAPAFVGIVFIFERL